MKNYLDILRPIPKHAYASMLAAFYLVFFVIASSFSSREFLVSIALLAILQMISMFIVSWRMNTLTLIDFVAEIISTIGLRATITYWRPMPINTVIITVLCIITGLVAFLISKRTKSERKGYNIKSAIGYVFVIPLYIALK